MCLQSWGGAKITDTSFESNYREITLHPENEQGEDLYTATDTVDFTFENNEYTVGMYRVKGKLIVLHESLPDSMTHVSHEAQELYSNVTPSLVYSGTTHVSGFEQRPDMSDETLLKTYLAPSVRTDHSPFQIGFYGNGSDSEHPSLKPPNVEMGIERNRITVLKYAYQLDGSFKVYILINDSWESLHNLVID